MYYTKDWGVDIRIIKEEMTILAHCRLAGLVSDGMPNGRI